MPLQAQDQWWSLYIFLEVILALHRENIPELLQNVVILQSQFGFSWIIQDMYSILLATFSSAFLCLNRWQLRHRYCYKHTLNYSWPGLSRISLIFVMIVEDFITFCHDCCWQCAQILCKVDDLRPKLTEQLFACPQLVLWSWHIPKTTYFIVSNQYQVNIST